MRNLAIALAFGIFCVAANSVQAQTATYDPATGAVVLDGLGDLGGALGSVEARGPGLLGGNGNALNGLYQDDGDVATWVWFFGAPTASADLGAIFPTGLDEAAGAAYGVGTIVAGSGATEFTPVSITGFIPAVVPEPGTVALAGLGLIGLGLVRRRRG